VKKSYTCLFIALWVGVITVGLLAFGTGTSEVQALRDAESGYSPLNSSVSNQSPSLMSTSSFTTYLPLAHRAILRPACANPQMDDFSDPQSGWPTGSLYGGVNIGYSEGKYYVEYSYPSYTDFRFSNGWQASDFYLDVEAQLINSENEGDEYGLIFGQNPDAFEFYVFSVEPQSGGYSLVRWAPDFDDVDTLVWGDSDAIRPGKSVNRLAVQRAGSQIKLWINGVLVAETSDGMFTGEREVGLYTSGWDVLEVHFDNFYLCAD
jgi:hypothetical protein